MSTASLTRSALSGVAWNWGGSIVLVFAQIASTAATARLVAPDEFGLYATAQAAAAFAGYFAMTAVAQDLQRRSTLGPKTVGTAVTVSLTSSATVALAFLLLAGPWASVWGVPEAADIVRIFALVTFLTASTAVPIGLLRRRLAFGRAATIETVSQVVGLAAGVGMAVALHSAVALAIGQVVAAALLLASSVLLSRRELSLAFDRADARSLATFGGQIGFLGFAAYLANTAPSWFAARVFGASVLGLYSRAYFIVSLPATYAATSIFKVIFPLYGRVRDSSTRTRAMLEEGLTLTTGALWPAFALLAGAAPVVVEILLGSRWSEAAPFVALVALGACANVPTGVLTNAAEARGWIRIVVVRQSALIAGVGAGMLVVYLNDLSLSWLLASVAAAQWIILGITLSPFIRSGLISSTSLIRSQSTHAVIALAIYGVTAASTWLASSAPIEIRGLIVALVAGTSVAILAALGNRYPAGAVLRLRLGHAFPADRRPELLKIGAAP